jgi:tRNA(Ile)-lysidine synthase
MPPCPPVDDARFAAVMEPLGPFERSPCLAVAVSGGADSMALCLLADRWARMRGGRVVGLIVDHGLRPEAAAEAAAVGGWLAVRGISHHVLHWTADKPNSGVQAAARRARYALLREWCAGAGVLHLLLAHHQDDQAETVLLRLARGSGVDGLAAMAPIVATPELCILRPLLAIPRAHLVATLTACGQTWLDDPSNANPVFQRVRLRRMAPALAAEGMTPRRLAATAGRFEQARQALEQATADLMVDAVTLDPAGFARLDIGRLARAPRDVSLRLVGRVCRTIGGGCYPSRLDKLERLLGELLDGLAKRRSFAGCLLSGRPGGVLVTREPAAMAGPRPATAGQTVWWDNRFTMCLAGSGSARVAALGRGGWLAVRQKIAAPGLPPPVLPTIPALFDQHGICCIPHLNYTRGESSGPTAQYVAFTPVCPLAGVGRCLV